MAKLGHLIRHRVRWWGMESEVACMGPDLTLKFEPEPAALRTCLCSMRLPERFLRPTNTGAPLVYRSCQQSQASCRAALMRYRPRCK